jgi:TolB-like protein/tetratricopeptide (TPR) repeat protein
MGDQVERKLTAILAADVGGYSRLMAADEEGTLAGLKSHRRELVDPKIKEHRGRIIKTTGDGMLVEFASVVDAVRCAIDVQRGMAVRNQEVVPDRRIEFRVGINIGDVIVDGDDIYGDGVNIAARLENIAELGGVCVSATVRDHVLDKLGFAFDGLGDQNVKNIPRPVRVYRVQFGDDQTNHVVSSQPASQRIVSVAPRLSIVVLPLTNIGGDPEQEYFVAGVTESLTTDLSRISGSFVIGRNTAFTYKGKAVDLKQVGNELGVRYVLEGSVQRGGNRLRVNIQLIDAESGKHLWAERFDKPLADLFDMQDEIVAHLANQLGTELVAAEARRSERAPQPDSMDLYFQGLASVNRGLTPEYMAQARGFFERALALDPSNIEALVGTAMVDSLVGGSFFVDDRAARFAAAETTLIKALSLAPNHAIAHYLLGFVQISTNRAGQGIAECERALALDRNLAGAHAEIGLAKYNIGRAEETEAHIREALRLSPRDTSAYAWKAFAGYAKLYLGSDEEAAAWLHRAIETNRSYSLQHFALACALAHLGQLDDARAAVQAGLALNSTFTLRRFRAGTSSNNPTFLAQRERIYDGMRKAGVPEG